MTRSPLIGEIRVTISDEAWDRLEDEATRLTEQNRVELTAKAQTDPELAVKAMTEYLDTLSMDTIARILWREREYELETAETFAPGLLARTDLALLFKDAAGEYAKYEAETVTPEQLEQQLQQP